MFLESLARCLSIDHGFIKILIMIIIGAKSYNLMPGIF